MKEATRDAQWKGKEKKNPKKIKLEKGKESR